MSLPKEMCTLWTFSIVLSASFAFCFTSSKVPSKGTKGEDHPSNLPLRVKWKFCLFVLYQLADFSLLTCYAILSRLEASIGQDLCVKTVVPSSFGFLYGSIKDWDTLSLQRCRLPFMWVWNKYPEMISVLISGVLYERWKVDSVSSNVTSDLQSFFHFGNKLSCSK